MEAIHSSQALRLLATLSIAILLGRGCSRAVRPKGERTFLRELRLVSLQFDLWKAGLGDYPGSEEELRKVHRFPIEYWERRGLVVTYSRDSEEGYVVIVSPQSMKSELLVDRGEGAARSFRMTAGAIYAADIRQASLLPVTRSSAVSWRQMRFSWKTAEGEQCDGNTGG